MDVRLSGHFALCSPLSHIGESLSTTSYLVQEPVLQPDGSLSEVFVYSGNAWRGQLRDLAAAYLLSHLGDPTLALDAFHLLFSGGRIGGEQSVDIAKARAYRRAIPLIALWGGGVGNQILPGKLRVGNSYPVCAEALPALRHTSSDEACGISYRSLTFEKSFSRKDDGKDDRLRRWLASDESPVPAVAAQATFGEPPPAAKPSKAPKRDDGPADQMRMTSELVAAGTRLETTIDVLDVSEVELGCLVSAVHTWARSPHIGGQASRGHGLADLAYTMVDLDSGETRPFLAVRGGTVALADPAAEAKDAYDRHVRDMYDAMLAANGAEMRQLLGAVS